LEAFQSSEVRKEKSENCQICIFGFHCIAKKYIEMIEEIFILFLIYSQIWLDLPREDHTTLAANKNSLKTTLTHRSYNVYPKSE
jgi:hypothetical protein